MNVEEIIEKVGRDAFEDYSRRSWASAKVTGTKLARLPPYIEEEDAYYHADFDLEYEIAETIWGLGTSDVSKFHLFFQFYRRAPNYTWLHELELCLWSFSEKTRDVFWSEMSKLISEEDERLVNPARYCLWCGPFEDAKKVNDAWRSLLASELNQSGLQWLLATSGPVPYPLKKGLYDKLISIDQWHPYIFDSLVKSFLDSFGQIDKNDAIQILQQLNIPDRTDDLIAFKKDLES